MFKQIMSNSVSKLLFQAGVIYAGLAFMSQMIMVITAMYAPYVIGALLVIISILNVKLKELVKKVVKELFVEIASSLVFRKQHVLLRGFAKIVIQGIAKNNYKSHDPMQYETRAEEEWKKPQTDE